MVSEFWLGVIITLIVGIPGAYGMAILANMHTPRLVHFFESRKLLKKHKTRQQALVGFNRTKAFHEGTRDRYSFYILFASGAVISAIVASTLLLIISVQHGEVYPLSPGYGMLAGLAAIAMATALILLAGIYETARQLERFDDYKAEFEARWGPLDD
jgi:hypothetical protein